MIKYVLLVLPDYTRKEVVKLSVDVVLCDSLETLVASTSMKTSQVLCSLHHSATLVAEGCFNSDGASQERRASPFRGNSSEVERFKKGISI